MTVCSRRTLAAAVTAAALLTACAGAVTSDPAATSARAPDPAPSPTSTSAAAGTTISPATTTSPEWSAIDGELSALGRRVGFLAARVTGDGTCEPIHAIEPSAPRPTGSQFKLFVLGALAGEVAAGRLSWEQTLTVDDSTKSLGNGDGSLQAAVPGTVVSVEEAATKMTSISDNTATDMLIGLLDRPVIEATFDKWTAEPGRNTPLLTTREMLLLHYVPGLADRYLATAMEQRGAFLAASVDPLSLTEIAAGLSPDPRYIDDVEWFASPDDICRAFAGLLGLAQDAALAPLSTILSRETVGIGLDPSRWPSVWFKGGSEPGVLTLGWLATTSTGTSYVVQAMVSDPDAPLTAESINQLVALARRSFDLVAP